MGGLAESAAGYVPITPAAVPLTEINRCANTKYECNSIGAQLKTAVDALDREKSANDERMNRLMELEAVLQGGELGGQYSLNMQRIRQMQDIDVIQRSNIMETEEANAELRKRIRDMENGTLESSAVSKLRKVTEMLRTIPHSGICKVDAGAPCVCHHKAIKGILDA